MGSIRVGAVIFVLGFSLMPLQGALAKNVAVRIIVNSQPLTFDQPPVIVRGQVFVPFLAILRPLELSGAVMADEAFAATRVGYAAVTFSAARSEAWVFVKQGDCRVRPIKDRPRVIGGRFMVPLRILAEAVGVSVRWDAMAHTAFLTFPAGQARSAIKPPAPVKAVPVKGRWSVTPPIITPSVPITCATCDEFPLTLGLGATAEADSGEPIDINVSFINRTGSTVGLRRPLTLNVRVGREHGCAPLWEGTLPPLAGSIPPYGSAQLHLTWDQRDVSERLVQRDAKCVAYIAFPFTIFYTQNGTVGEEHLTLSSGHKLGGEIDFAWIHIR